MKHFHYFPQIEYSDEAAVNIMVRGKIRDAILQRRALYYKYTISPGERPDIIASKYYDNPRHTWALFYANNMFHPIHDWPMDDNVFTKYLETKYGVSYPRGALALPHHYEVVDQATGQNLIIDEATYNTYSIDAQHTVKEVSVYDHEVEMNDKKRNIVIIDKSYILDLTNELSKLFK
jgi:hypothetical protein